jgi:hypothetical protein
MDKHTGIFVLLAMIMASAMANAAVRLALEFRWSINRPFCWTPICMWGLPG